MVRRKQPATTLEPQAELVLSRMEAVGSALEAGRDDLREAAPELAEMCGKMWDMLNELMTTEE